MATQEILDELRPQMCPIEHGFFNTMKMFRLFLPVNLPPDLHNHGFKFVGFLFFLFFFVRFVTSDYGYQSFLVSGKVSTTKQFGKW
jgi:hypothetical protein